MHITSFEPAVGDRQKHGDAVGLIRPMRRVPESLARIADSYLLVYRMPAVRGGQAIATAMLFVPRAPSTLRVPRSRLLSWYGRLVSSLGAESLRRECEPSKNGRTLGTCAARGRSASSRSRCGRARLRGPR